MNQALGNAQLEIGHVISRTFATIGANFATFLLLAILFAGLPAVLVGYLTQAVLFPLVMSNADPSSYLGMFYLVQFVGVMLMWLPLYVLIGALTHGSVMYLNGERASLASCLGTGFSRSLHLLGLGLLSALGMTFLLVLLVVPGIMAAVRWSVAAPALVVERTGVFGAFSRSGDLTRGNRWRIFWLFVIWVIAGYIIQLCVAALIGLAAGTIASVGYGAVWIYFGITGINAAISNMIGAAGSAALYAELREIKDGATSEQLAKVFD